MKKNNTFRRAAALVAALSITVSLAAPAFAGTYYIDDGDITIIKNENGSQTIKQQGKEDCTDQVGDETIITTHKKAITTLESDLEGPAAEDSGFGPVVEDNYQPAPPAQPEDAEEPKDADQPEDDDQKNAEESENDEEQKDADRQENTDRKESAEEPEDADRKESAGQQAQPQQAAPAAAAPAAPAAPTSVITLINNFANKVLNLTLKDVKIDVSNTGRENHAGKAALSVQGEGNVEIELDGKNELKSGYYRAGLEKNTSAGTLTLKDDNKEAGSGSLNAEGGALSAGIGGSYNGDSANNGTKNIIITGGTVTATGGDGGAGIGGGNGGAAENITITGSTVTATGGSALGFGGAGIGGGGDGRNSDSNGKNITITGSTVTAKGGNGSAGIGGGVAGIGEAITITGSTVTATGGIGAAGIGGGIGGSGKAITITGGTANATGGEFGAGIGGGERCDGENITITGSTVTATGDRGGAGIGGGAGESNRGNGNGNNITITGSTVTAISNGCGQRGNGGGAGIGGGCNRNGSHITINGGTVTAEGGDHGAGIGGGAKGSGSNVTVSGAAQVTAIAGKGDRWDGAGATIGSGSGGSTKNPDGTFTPGSGQEIQANISGLITGWIHHIIYDPALVSEDNPDGILKEWWEPERPQPNPEDPNAPAEESNEVSLGTPGLHVETLEGDLLPFNARQQGSTLRVTTDNLAARLHGTRQALEALREQGVEQIQFVTSFKTTTLSVEDLLAEGGSWFALEHNGLVSRRLSAAQAESLKCWRH